MKVRVMAPEYERHPGGEEWENYARGLLSGEKTSQYAEHLLTCEVCRRQLSETEAFVWSVQRAGQKIQLREEPDWRWWLLPRLAPALAGLAVLALGISLWLGTPPGGPPVAITLATTRGNQVAAQAPPSRPLDLQPDLAGLPPSSAYRLEMVDRGGRRLWQADLHPAAGEFTARAPAATPGLYFVRVYTPAGVLLREYALAIGSQK